MRKQQLAKRVLTLLVLVFVAALVVVTWQELMYVPNLNFSPQEPDRVVPWETEDERAKWKSEIFDVQDAADGVLRIKIDATEPVKEGVDRRWTINGWPSARGGLGYSLEKNARGELELVVQAPSISGSRLIDKQYETPRRNETDWVDGRFASDGRPGGLEVHVRLPVAGLDKVTPVSRSVVAASLQGEGITQAALSEGQRLWDAEKEKHKAAVKNYSTLLAAALSDTKSPLHAAVQQAWKQSRQSRDTATRIFAFRRDKKVTSDVVTSDVPDLDAAGLKLDGLPERGVCIHVLDGKVEAKRRVEFQVWGWVSPRFGLLTELQSPRVFPRGGLEISTIELGAIEVVSRREPPPSQQEHVQAIAKPELKKYYDGVRSSLVEWLYSRDLEAHFQAYSALLAVNLGTKQLSASEEEKQLFAAKLELARDLAKPEQLQKLISAGKEVGDLARSSYGFTYSYCYYMLCCVEVLDLFMATPDLDTINPEAKQRLRQSISEAVDRIKASLRSDGGIRNLDKHGDADRSVAGVALYALWKVTAVRQSTDYGVDLNDCAKKASDGVRSLRGYIAGPSSGWLATVGGDGHWGVPYTEGAPSSNLLPIFLMAQAADHEFGPGLLMPGSASSALWKGYISDPYCNAKKVANSDFHHWYQVVYLCRALEVLSYYKAKPGTEFREVYDRLWQTIQENMGKRVHEKLKLEGRELTFYMIAQHTLTKIVGDGND